MIDWLKERLKNLPFYLIIILGVGFLGVKFLQRTEKTVVQSGGTQINPNKDAKVTALPFSCISIQAERFMKEIK